MLEGIKVVEYATYMAAPGAGSILSDWGADVVKIEPPGGDPIRLFFKTIGTDITDNPVFDFDNRGKKSIVVDTSKPEGQELVRKLVADAVVWAARQVSTWAKNIAAQDQTVIDAAPGDGYEL